MTTIPKWDADRTNKLVAEVGNESPVTKATVESLATSLETSGRSVAAKLRKLGYEVEAAGAAPKAFSDEETADLREFVESNAGSFTFGEIAEQFNGGKFTAKAIQGKILSMELNGSVKPTPKAEAVKTYTDAEQAQVVSLIKAGAFVEDIATALNKSVASIRGKALSLLRSGDIDAIPKQKEVKGAAPDAFEALGDVSAMTVAQIAAALEKTDRGVKTMLTRRGVKALDYDGEAKAKKAAE